jgi:cytochrome c551/c552
MIYKMTNIPVVTQMTQLTEFVDEDATSKHSDEATSERKCTIPSNFCTTTAVGVVTPSWQSKRKAATNARLKIAKSVRKSVGIVVGVLIKKQLTVSDEAIVGKQVLGYVIDKSRSKYVCKFDNGSKLTLSSHEFEFVTNYPKKNILGKDKNGNLTTMSVQDMVLATQSNENIHR